LSTIPLAGAALEAGSTLSFAKSDYDTSASAGAITIGRTREQLNLAEYSVSSVGL